MRIKGVLFDFDGTLTRPDALDFPAIKRKLGCPLDQPILEYLETLPPGQRSGLMKVLEDIEDKAAEISRPNEGAEKCISALKEKGIVLGILTRNGLSSVKKALKKYYAVIQEWLDAELKSGFQIEKLLELLEGLGARD